LELFFIAFVLFALLLELVFFGFEEVVFFVQELQISLQLLDFLLIFVGVPTLTRLH
jgi:hypothetical protein